MSARGRLYSFEGLDGTGKSTQQQRLAESLRRRGWEVLCSREPTTGPAGARLRTWAAQGLRLAAQDELALFLQDRRQHVETLLGPALDRGAVVLLDRYYHSTIAYQGARGLDPERVRAANEVFAPRPDRIFLLEADLDTCLTRVSRRGAPDAFEQRELLARVAAGFDALDDEGLVRLDARLPLGVLAERILHQALDDLSHALPGRAAIAYTGVEPPAQEGSR